MSATTGYVMDKTERQQAIDAEKARLEASHYGEKWSFKHNGRRLSVDEMAALEVDNRARFQKNIDDMVRSGCGPATVTDTDFHREVGTGGRIGALDQQFKRLFDKPEKALRDAAYAHKCRGKSLNCDTFYDPQLDTYKAGKPQFAAEAFIDHSDGRAEVRRRYQAAGKGVTQGMCECKAPDVEPAPKKRKGINKATFAAWTKQALAKNPELKRKSVRELKSMAIDAVGVKK